MNWQDEAACHDDYIAAYEPLVYGLFIEENCQHCPVIEQCLALGLEIEAQDRMRWGIWGGLTPQERNIKDGTHYKCDQGTD